MPASGHPEPGLISVRTEVVLDTLVGSLADGVSGRLDAPLPEAAEAALMLVGDLRERRLARAGYLARALEVERFERARAPMPWLVERFGSGGGWSAAAAELAVELAAAEPRERPEPGDDRAVSWKVPGPGGHVRHYLALRTADDGRDAGPARDAKRPWLAGFLIHCIHEAAPPARLDNTP